MSTLSQRDVHHILARIPKDVVQLLRDDPRVFIAGGIIRALIGGEDPADIDLFGPGLVELQTVANKLMTIRLGKGEHPTMSATANAITILTPGRLPVQLITRWAYTTAQQVSDSFDFTICQAAIYYKPPVKGTPINPGGIPTPAVPGEFLSVCSHRFYEDLAARRLVYTAPQRDEDAGGSMLRVIKYLKRGYNIQVDSLAAVCARLFRGMWTQDDHWKDEGQRTIMLQQILRAVDPLMMIDGIELGEDDHHPPQRIA